MTNESSLTNTVHRWRVAAFDDQGAETKVFYYRGLYARALERALEFSEMKEAASLRIEMRPELRHYTSAKRPPRPPREKHPPGALILHNKPGVTVELHPKKADALSTTPENTAITWRIIVKDDKGRTKRTVKFRGTFSEATAEAYEVAEKQK